MGLFENFPYTNFQNLNLDYLLKQTKKNSENIASVQQTINDTINTLFQNALDDGTIASLINDELLGDINTSISNIKGNSLLCIGDSYLEGYNPDGNTPGWGELLRQSMGIPTANYHAYYSGGSGFTASNSYQGMINQAIAEIDSNEKEKIKNIVIGGGWGDRNVTASIKNLTDEAYSSLHTAFPFAKIHYFFAAFCNASIHTDTPVSKFAVARRFIESDCSRSGFHVLPGGSVCLYGNGSFGSDGYHPTNAGQIALNNFLSSGLHGNPIFPPTQTFNLIGVGGTGTFNAKYKATSEYIEITIENFNANLENITITCNGQQEIVIGNISESFPFTSIEYTNIAATAIVRKSSGTPRYQAIPGAIVLGNRAIKFSPLETTTDGTNFLSITNVDNISFYNMPTLKFSPVY